ncbi:MAG: type II toxin-antitoxin system VapC family toxin [Candidatus Dormibacteraceae bacterium]
MRSLLLDTNVVVWLLVDDRRSISGSALAALEDEDNRTFVSAASVWEIAIKRSLGNLDLDPRWAAVLTGLDFDRLPVTSEHAAYVEHLPWHHRDPFDRLLVAQAIVEGDALVTSDRRLRTYGVDVVW